MTRYRLTFEFTETEEKAIELCKRLNDRATRYIRTHKPAHYTPWQANSNTDPMHFIVWYYA